MKRSIILVIVALFFLPLFGQKQYSVGLIGFYNLENLFDTIDDPQINDAEFLPDGSMSWGTMKYQNKLVNMSKAISMIGDNSIKCPHVLGVSEIENRLVLEDLIAQPALAAYDFDIVHYDGPDRRGVDVALLYQKSHFTVLGSRSVRLTTEDDTNFRTRDQLVVSGLFNGDTMHFIVGHWPSRYGGEKRSAPKRKAAALLTKTICDSILAVSPDAKIVIMGDLNDDPTNESVKKWLAVKDDQKKVNRGELFNTTYKLFKDGVGSLAYRDNWNLFDQIIISHGLLGNDYSTYKYYRTNVFNDPMLKEKDGRYAGYPLRTHAGGVYKNGYSDHFPVYMKVIREVKE